MSERPPSPGATSASRPHGRAGAPEPVATAGAPGARGRIAALDGLRGLALLGMLAWHAEVGWVKGGFARMTIFFVLSGYLATASWLALRDRGTERPFGTFWRRRARRLLPITLVGVALATAVTAWIGERGAVQDLPGDATSVVAGVSNWRFLFADRSYGELFERPSAFQHFWSLSLEEQLFWLLPLLVAGAVWVARHRAWLAAAVGAVLLAGIPLVVEHSPDAAYYGTHVRAGEFLVGVAFALLLHRAGGQVPERWVRPVQVAGTLSLAVLIVVMVTVDRDHGWLYAGGMGLFAIPAVAVVAATRVGRSPATALLALPPLVWMGRAALSIYALHWPLFQVLDTERTGLRGPWLATVQIAVGIGVGLVVYRWAEEPLIRRTRSGSADRRLLPALAASTAVIVVAALLVPLPPAPYDLRALERRLAGDSDIDLERSQLVLASSPAPAAPPADALLADDEVRVALFGGSTSVVLGATGAAASDRSEVFDLAPGYARLGCGLLVEGERVHGRTSDGAPAWAPTDDYCLGWDLRWPAVVVDQDVDLAVVMTGVWETADWRLPGSDDAIAVGDPAIDARLVSAVNTAIDVLHGRGAVVVLVTTPEIGRGRDGTARERRSLGEDHEERVARFNAMLRFVATARADVHLIDYGAYIDGMTDEQRAEWLPDGIHPTEEAAARIWQDHLGPALETVIASQRTAAS